MRSVAALCMLASLAACANVAPPPPATSASEAAAAPDATPARSRGADVVFTAMSFLDTPYRRGGNDAEQGFDCSGFTRHVFAQTLGLPLPRRSEDQARTLRNNVERDDLAPGDLVFFNTLHRAYSHVGIYLGDGRFIHAPRTGSAVRVEDMRSAYWARRFNGARRAVEGADPVAQ